MATFEDLWQLLYDHGSSNYHKHDCFRLWDSLTTEKQQALFDSISERLQKSQYVAYNPIEAMNDNMPRAGMPSKEPEPTNYNRSNLTPKEPIEPAFYKGEWGMYTLTDIRTYGLQTKQKAGN